MDSLYLSFVLCRHAACVICAQLIPGYLNYDCSLFISFSAIVSDTHAVTQDTISHNSSAVW